MFKRNSIFIRILVPVIIVVLFQISLVSMVLIVNGTISSLSDSSIEALTQNTENRAITLENMMIYYWSNLDKLELDLNAEIEKYLYENNLNIKDVTGEQTYENHVLNNVSDSMINALRQTSATGIFLYFIDEEMRYGGNEIECSGLYYRDLDPVSTPADYSDILYVRGFVDIARKDMIQLDSLWRETFVFSPRNEEDWEKYTSPRDVWDNYTGVASSDLAFWYKPQLLDPSSPLDARKYVTYIRPVFYDGELVAVIGTEVQTNQLIKYFPANDYDNSGKSGYILFMYDEENSTEEEITGELFLITGSYIKRLFGTQKDVTLVPTRRDGVYKAESVDSESVLLVMRPLRLYNTNAPFSNEQWVLAAVGTESLLFEASENVSRGILFASSLALTFGTVILAFIIRMSTKPLIDMAHQIEHSDPDYPVVVSNSSIYEITLLSSTINAMKDKSRYAESRLREERERYLIALESTDDTFMEYDVEQDIMLLYCFTGDNQKTELSSLKITDFKEKLLNGEICHPDDAENVKAFSASRTTESAELRARVEFFPNIGNVEPDGDYYWFRFKASHILNDDGKLTKIIFTAREITQTKLEEFQRIETLRRDPVSDFYYRSYGMRQIDEFIAADDKIAAEYAVCCAIVGDYELFEANYGSFFCGVIYYEFSRHIHRIMESTDVAVRYANDVCFVIFRNTDKNTITQKLLDIYDSVDNIYIGENTDLRFNLSLGVSMSSDTGNAVQNARRAVETAIRSNSGSIVFYSDLKTEEQNAIDDIYMDKPITVSFDLKKPNIVSFAFELFERTSDVHSAVNMLLRILCDMFELRRVVICAYDADFGADRVSYQYAREGIPPYPTNIEKVDIRVLHEFESILDENGALLFNADTVYGCSDGVKRLLHTHSEDDFIAYCCVMYENGVNTGRILFINSERDCEWDVPSLTWLYEISKVVAAHLNVEKSNSASRAKSEFLSRISHEIRTPMNAILGMVDIAQNSVDDNPERLTDSLSKIEFSAKHLLSLINDVLEVSRIESGKLQIEPVPFSISDFIGGVDTLMRPPIETKNIKFTIINETKHDNVIGDAYRLRQVIVNFLGNANKFTEPGGEIVFTIEETSEAPAHIALTDGAEDCGFFRFSVRDNGVGINVEDQPQIFRAFEQARSSETSYKRQGTGLGLTISSSIVTAMGSKIELVSKPGMGSDFFFTLKMSIDDSYVRDAVQEEEFDYNGRFTGYRALLAEDNDINIEIALYILEETGLTIDVAHNGEEAVRMFNNSQVNYYNVILMDIQMPVMDGLTAARNIRKNTSRPDARSIPIIAMTANAFDEDMKKSVESGMNGHVAKPIDTTTLFETLRKLLIKPNENNKLNLK